MCVREPVPSMLDCRIEMTGASHPGIWDSVPESWWQARSFFTPALLQLFDMIDAVTSLSTDSPLQRLWIKIHPCWRLHLKLVVRAVFHVETKGPALQPLLLITETIRLCWVNQDEKWCIWVLMMLPSDSFLSSDQNIPPSPNPKTGRQLQVPNLPTTTFYSHFPL